MVNRRGPGKWKWNGPLPNRGPPYDHSKYSFHIKLLPDPDLPATGQAWEVRVVIQSHSSIPLIRGDFRWSAANIEPSPPNLPKPVDRQLSGHSHCWEWKLREYPGKKAEECKWSASLFLFADTVDTLLEFRLEQLCRDNIRIVWGGSTSWPDRWIPAYRRDDPEKFNRHNWWFCPEYRMMKPAAPLYDDYDDYNDHNWWFCPEYRMMKPAAPLYDDYDDYNDHNWWFCPEYQIMKPAALSHDDGGNKEEENQGGGYLDADNKDEEIGDDDDMDSEIDHMVEGFVLL